ncbi:unnamed protein product [Miscanthus lutarioriparius]|uniref:Uncharacterized protein n=1 Tax=Miscanthus lutarioriparius TaxID=422564 RepID=A0A811MM96_9POAL|nr:unnamed protein product [Miscanthus lutarioriparius]
MEQPKQQLPQVPPRDAAAGGKNKRDDMHKTTGDVMTHSFGEGYSTRSDEEGFGGVYGGNDPVEHPGTEIHPSHPDYDTSQGSEVKKEKARPSRTKSTPPPRRRRLYQSGLSDV